MNQSYKTAIKRIKPSKPMRILEKKGLLNGGLLGLDYGCGQGFDAQHYGLDKFDPHWFNVEPLLKSYDFITCNYVLNVISNEEERKKVLDKIKSLLSSQGVAYISVRRDLSAPVVKGRGCDQVIVKLDLPILYEDKSTCIYYMNA